MAALTKSLLHQTWFNGLRSLLYASGFVVLLAWIVLQLRVVDARFGLALPAATVALGFVLLLAGAALAISCIATFVIRGRGTPALFDPPRRFVAAGPYRYVRNPMYLGGFALLFGLSLSLRSISLVLMTVLLMPLCHLLVVLHEEPSLTRKFGEPYQTYLATVRRWLPYPSAAGSLSAPRSS